MSENGAFLIENELVVKDFVKDVKAKRHKLL